MIQTVSKYGLRLLIYTLGVALVIAVPLLIESYRFEHAIKLFDIKMNETLVIGKTTDQIVARYGIPSNRTEIDSNGNQTFFYNGPYGSVCRIDFEKSVAKRTIQWVK